MALGASYNEHDAVQVFVTLAIVAMFGFIILFLCREVYDAKYPAARMDYFIAHHSHTAGLIDAPSRLNWNTIPAARLCSTRTRKESGRRL